MTKEELFDELGHPIMVWDESMNVEATKSSFYLYEVHQVGPTSYENKVWFFDTVDAFKRFTYSLDLIDFIFQIDDEEFSEDEFESERPFQFYSEMQKRQWTIEDCKQYVNEYNHCLMDLIHFGSVQELLNVNDVQFEKCKSLIFSIEELERNHLHEAEYQIMNDYAQISERSPMQSADRFLQFLNESC